VTNVSRALNFLKINNELVDSPELWSRFSHLILPGVGSFGYGMAGLRERNLVDSILSATDNGVPLLGICLGMQLLFESSEEGLGTDGLSLIAGVVQKLQSGELHEQHRVPHVGWSQITTSEANSLNSLVDGTFYFVHSFHAAPLSDEAITSRCVVGDSDFVSSVSIENVTGLQFHPEKSSADGLAVLSEWFET
jgi:glutamine amidotransferase